MNQNSLSAKRTQRRNIWQYHTILAMSLIWLLPALACGSFAPRPTPTPTVNAVLPQAVPDDGGAVNVENTATATPVTIIEESPTTAPTLAPTATFTPTPEPGTALVVGQPARVSAPNGLNLRETASAGAALVLQLGTGQLVDVVGGPTTADNYTWWQLDDRQGNVGWAAEGDGETEWLSPRIGGAQPANRSPRVGDRVTIAIQLSLRAQPGTGAALLTEISPGSQFSVLAGPQPADGFNWYQLRSDDGTLQGWAAEGDGTERWISPLE